MRIKFLPLLGISSFSLLLNATDATWIINGNGDWFTPANWSPAVPNATGDVANFNSPPPTPITVRDITVSLSASPSIGQLFIDGATNYTIGPANGLIFSNTAGQQPTIEIDNTHGNGHHTISCNVTISPPNFPKSLTINQNSTSPLTISGNINQTVPSPFGLVEYFGPGVTILSGNNTFLELHILGGTVSVSSQANLGDPTVTPLDIENNATLLTTANFTMSRNIFTSSGATINTQSGTTLTYTGIITSLFGAPFHKDGAGVLEIDGTASIDGVTEVINGDLRILGSLSNTGTGGVVVDFFGTLSGTSVGTDLFNTNVINRGTLSPGVAPTPGTMTIKGSLTQNFTSAALSINYVDPSTFSQLEVAGSPATADITDSTLLVLLAPNAKVVTNTNFKILQTIGPLTGQFIDVGTNTPFYQATAIYDPTSVSIFFTMTPPVLAAALAKAATAGQAMTVASANQTIYLARTSQAILHDKMQNKDDAACATAFHNRVKQCEAPELHMAAAAHPSADIMLVSDGPYLSQVDQQSETKQEQLRTRIPPAPSEFYPARLYLGPTGGFGKVDHVHYWTAGAQAGFDYAFSQIGIGTLLEYVHGNGKGFSADQTKLTLYSVYVPSRFPQISLGAIVGGGLDWYHFRTSQKTFTGTKTVRGSPDGTQFYSTIDLAYSINNGLIPRMANNFQISPYISLQYSQVHIDGYREHGAGDFDLQIKGQTLKFLLLTLEARVSYVKEWKNVSLTPMFFAGWQRDFLDHENEIQFRFVHLDDDFKKAHLKNFGRNYALAGMDLALYFYKKYGVEVSYNFHWNKLYYDNKFYLGFNYLF